MRLFILIILLFGIGISRLFSQYAGGSGTAASPYQISDLTHLQNMDLNLGSHFILLNDIDASASSGWNGGDGFDPVGPDGITPFSGTFDGNNYTISNLHINRTSEENVAIFGFLDDDAFVMNVTVANCNVSGSISVAAVAGYNKGTIDNCHSSGNVIATDQEAGGICGDNGSDPGTSTYPKLIKNCTSSAIVSGGSIAREIGGICGDNDGTIENCSARGSISGEDKVGGLIGDNDGYVNNCYSIGNVSGKDDVGGFIGFNYIYSEVVNCYSTGNVIGEQACGGFIGSNHYNAEVQKCYSTGKVTSNDDYIGGFVGFNEGFIKNCHSTGNTEGDNSVGGFCGFQEFSGYIGFSYTHCTVTALDEAAGGFIGYNDGIVEESNARSLTTAYLFSGGFVGINDFYGEIGLSYAVGEAHSSYAVAGGFGGLNFGYFFMTWASGDAYGQQDVGGHTGYTDGALVLYSFAHGNAIASSSSSSWTGGFSGSIYDSEIEECYSIGQVVGTNLVGGFCGDNDNTIYKCSYWDMNRSGHNDGFGDGYTDPNVSGLTTAQMQDPNQTVFKNCGWNYSTTWTYIQNNPPVLQLVYSNFALIPTMTEWALIILGSLLAIGGGWIVWRRMA